MPIAIHTGDSRDVADAPQPIVQVPRRPRRADPREYRVHRVGVQPPRHKGIAVVAIKVRPRIAERVVREAFGLPGP